MASRSHRTVGIAAEAHGGIEKGFASIWIGRSWAPGLKPGRRGAVIADLGLDLHRSPAFGRAASGWRKLVEGTERHSSHHVVLSM